MKPPAYYLRFWTLHGLQSIPVQDTIASLSGCNAGLNQSYVVQCLLPGSSIFPQVTFNGLHLVHWAVAGHQFNHDFCWLWEHNFAAIRKHRHAFDPTAAKKAVKQRDTQCDCAARCKLYKYLGWYWLCLVSHMHCLGPQMTQDKKGKPRHVAETVVRCSSN